jgi:hypothetical protein
MAQLLKPTSSAMLGKWRLGEGNIAADYIMSNTHYAGSVFASFGDAAH